MRGWVGEGLQKGKARPAKAAARQIRVAATGASPPCVAPSATPNAGPEVGPNGAPTPGFPAGAWVVLAGPPAITLHVAVARGRTLAAQRGPGADLVVVVDAWGRPPPQGLRPKDSPLQAQAGGAAAPTCWARAAGPAAAVAMVEASLQRPEVACVVLHALSDLTGLARWPRTAATGVPAALCRVRRSGACVVALAPCRCARARGVATDAGAGADVGHEERAAAAAAARLWTLDGAHAAAVRRTGARGREMLDWASLRAQTCQPHSAALALSCCQ